MIDGEAPLRHDLLQVAVRQGISQVPPDAQEDDHVFEMPRRGTVLAVFGSRYTVPNRLEPRLQQNPPKGWHSRRCYLPVALPINTM